MRKAWKWILAAVALLLAAALALGGVFFTQRRRFMESELSLGPLRDVSMERRADGTVLLDWPGEPGEERYLLEVRRPGASAEEPLLSVLCRDSEHRLPADLPQEEALELRVYARSTWEMLGQREVRLCADPIVVRCALACPEAKELSVSCDYAASEAALTWTGREEDVYSLYVRRDGEEPRLLGELRGENARIRFGEGGDLPVPERGETYAFRLEARREIPGLRYPGVSSDEVTVIREDLLGVTLGLSCAAEDDSSFRLSWDETKGETYLVEGLFGGGEWQILAEIPAGEERTYFTGHLPPFGEYRFRVSASGGQARPEGENAVAPEETAVSTAATLIHAAGWSLMELDLYADPERQERIGSLSPDRAFCILGEENGSLLLGTPAGGGYVDEEYCMIDLPDYIGSLCEYRITNSTASIYMVHGVPIEKMTGEVITGYEKVALPDGGYLVPLLFPTAKKLIAAALALREDGYRLRIYDSFRPHVATRAVYDRAMEILDDPVSEEEDALTYRQLMTGDRYSLWDFLAAGISKHNRGIALDVAMVDIATGEELRMQTDIHDLSWYAATANNDENAAMLSAYMRGAGFGILSSEWWHYQDMEALGRLDPPCRVRGVTPEGWRADDRGWRYRCADGSFLAGETREIDGIDYTFGEDGYLLPD